MLQMPARVKFIKRRGLDSLFHKISNNLPRIKHFADNDYALTKPILQQCSESKHQSWSWVHRGHTQCGFVAKEKRTTMQKTSLSESLRSLQWGHTTCAKVGGAGLSANQITNVMWLQGLVCCRRDGTLKRTVCNLKASTVSFYSSFQDWQEKNWIGTKKADKIHT